MLEFGSNGYTGSLAGPARGPTMGTKIVKRERWRPAKALAGPADRHKRGNRVPLVVQH
jgi:hypothetical protein